MRVPARILGDAVQTFLIGLKAGVSLAHFAIFTGVAMEYQRPVQLTCAQLLVVIEVTVLGSFAKKFHALQQASTISS